MDIQKGGIMVMKRKEQVPGPAHGKGQPCLYIQTGEWDAEEQPHREVSGGFG